MNINFSFVINCNIYTLFDSDFSYGVVKISIKELFDLIQVESWQDNHKTNVEDLGYSAWYPIEVENTNNSKRISSKSLGTDFANLTTNNKILIHVKIRIFNMLT